MRFVRTSLHFEVGENIPCFLTSVKKVTGTRYDGSSWKAFVITHGNSFKDPRIENNKGELKKYFRDMYFYDDVKEIEWQIGYVLSILGGKPVTEYSDEGEYIDKTIEQFNSLKGKEYYLKTTIVRGEGNNKDKLYLRRGKHPYISRQPDLEYKTGEDKYRTFIVNK